MKKLLLTLLFTLPLTAAQLTFIAKVDNTVVAEEGLCHKRLSPCSTFKIALSLMGFESGILINTNQPKWYYTLLPDMYYLWQGPCATPTEWMQKNLVLYSEKITEKSGI